MTSRNHLILFVAILSLAACRKDAQRGHAHEHVSDAPVDGTFADIVTTARPGIVQILPTNPARRDAYYGSGFIVGEDGLVATNRHVVNNRNQVYIVRVWQQGTFMAKVVAYHPDKDIALLRLENPRGLAFRTLPFSQTLPDASKKVVNVGFSGDVGISAAESIIIAYHEDYETDDRIRYHDMIRSTRVLGPGSSGSPLLNDRGEVIGMHSTGGDYISSIPATYVKNAVDAFRRDGKIRGSYFGVSAKFRGDLNGWLLTRVPGGSPADEAGLVVGDVVTEVQGITLTSVHCISLAMDDHAPGSKIKVSFLRQGEPMEVTATLGEVSPR